MAVSATIQVQFSADAASNLYIDAEINSDDNNGKTTFLPGDSVYFRVYANVTFATTPTAGTVTTEETGFTEELEDYVTFTEEGDTTDTVSKLIHTLDSYTWYPSSGGLGTITQADAANEVQCSGSPSNTNPGVAKVNYTTTYTLMKLTPPSDFGEGMIVVVVYPAS